MTVLLACLALLAAPAAARAQSATLTFPTDGAVAADTTQPFTWTATPGASRYYLYVGSMPGAKDLVDTGATTATSWRVPPLPADRRLYARIWTEQNGTWTYSESSFTAARRVASMTFPTDGATGVDPARPFAWTPVDKAESYYLYVGTAQGAKDLVNTGTTNATSWSMPDLPTGKTLWARIHTKTDGFWRYEDISFTAGASSLSRPLRPADGAQNVDPAIPFSWTATPGAEGYQLQIGTILGGKDLVNVAGLTTTSYQAPPLPTGQTLYLRLWTKVNGAWQRRDSTFTAAPASRGILKTPRNDASNVDIGVPFTWYDAPGATAYYLYVGTTKGAKDLVNTGSITATSFQVQRTLPTGQPLWARLNTLVNGTWRFQDVQFTAGTPSRAVPKYPIDGTSAAKTQPFTWTTVPDARGYYLYVGTTKGAKDLADSGLLTGTSYSVQPLPVGQTLWARVWTYTAAGAWLSSDVSFKTNETAARLTYPDSRATPTGIDVRKPFTWTTAAGASAYNLVLGSSPGASDLGTTYATQATSWKPPALPIGTKVYARLLTQHNGRWNSWVDSSFTVAYSHASLGYPRNDQEQVDQTKPLNWKPIPGATSYEVLIGTTQGASDVARSGEITGSSYAPPTLPVGKPLWARLRTKASGTWVYGSDVRFTPGPLILSPAQRATGVDPGAAISWAPGAVLGGVDPAYALTLGTRPGGDDLFDSGPVSATSVDVPASAMPTGRPLYGRVTYVLGDGSKRRADVVFAAAGEEPEAARMTWGPAGSDAVDVGRPFAWSETDLAAGYRLVLLDGGGSVAADSGEIDVPRYFAPTLTAGTYTARLGTLIGGAWRWSEQPFTVTSTGPSAAAEVETAHWAADWVRHMADRGNHAFQWTRLNDILATSEGFAVAYCGHYAATLLEAMKEMNIAGHRGAAHQPQRVTTFFDYNPGDGHVLVKFWNAADSTWIPVDATFAIAPRRASDGRWASLEELHTATRTKDFASIEYVPLGDLGLDIARSYYLDYPLLFLNPNRQAPEVDPMPYVTPVGAPPVANGWRLYVVASDQKPLSLLVDGKDYSPVFVSPSGLSDSFFAGRIALPEGSSANVTVYEPNRYVF